MSPAALAPAPVAREHVEGLLRAKKLDQTLTSALPASRHDEAIAPFGVGALDGSLLGGLPRGHLSEIVGGVSSGKTTLAWAWLAAATSRGETVALIDTFDRFDPASAAACGIDLTRLLWVRGQALSKTGGAVDPAWLPGARTVEGPGTMLERTIDRALKALNLVLQSHVCTSVVLDIADVPAAGLRRIPMTTWLRVQRVIEGSETACVLLSPMPLARSAAGLTIATGAPGAPGALGAGGAACPERASASRGVRGPGAGVRWAGAHDRNRRVAGLDIESRVSSPRRATNATVAVHSQTRCEFGLAAVE